MNEWQEKAAAVSMEEWRECAVELAEALWACRRMIEKKQRAGYKLSEAEQDCLDRAAKALDDPEGTLGKQYPIPSY